MLYFCVFVFEAKKKRHCSVCSYLHLCYSICKIRVSSDMDHKLTLSNKVKLLLHDTLYIYYSKTVLPQTNTDVNSF